LLSVKSIVHFQLYRFIKL